MNELIIINFLIIKGGKRQDLLYLALYVNENKRPNENEHNVSYQDYNRVTQSTVHFLAVEQHLKR